MVELLGRNNFDREEWSELVKIADDMEPMTRVVLCEFARLFDSQGRSTTNHKMLAKAMGIPVKDVRDALITAKDRGWLEPVEIEGRKGYRATLPD